MCSKCQISMPYRDLIRNYRKNDVKKTLNGPIVIFLLIKAVAYLKCSKYHISRTDRDPIRNYHKNGVKKMLNGPVVNFLFIKGGVA